MRPYKPSKAIKEGFASETYLPAYSPASLPPGTYLQKEGTTQLLHDGEYPRQKGKKTPISVKKTRVPRRKTFHVRPGDTVEVENSRSPQSVHGTVLAYGVPDPRATPPHLLVYVVEVNGTPLHIPVSRLRVVRGGAKGSQPIPRRVKVKT